jgi:hypothetical protein
VQLMSAYLPDAIVFRLLLAANNKPDNSVIPHMGYADLDLVKNTFKQQRLPAFLFNSIGCCVNLAFFEPRNFSI